MIDLFREWDENNDGMIQRSEFRKALPMLGLHASRSEIDGLFDVFDADASGEISFRELNRQLRRDVRAERTVKVEVKSTPPDIIDVVALRKLVKQGLMSYSNVQVHVDDIDPITGQKRK